MSLIAAVLAWSLTAQIVIMTGVFFISGQLLPQLLGPIYALIPSSVLRTVVAAVLLFGPANWAVGYTYGHYPPGLVAPLMITCAIVANVGFAMLVIGARLTPALGVALIGVTAFAAWAALLLQQTK